MDLVSFCWWAGDKRLVSFGAVRLKLKLQLCRLEVAHEAFYVERVCLFVSNNKILRQRSGSEVLVLFAEGSRAADAAMLHYAHTKETRGHNLGRAVRNHLKRRGLIDSEQQL